MKLLSSLAGLVFASLAVPLGLEAQTVTNEIWLASGYNTALSSSSWNTTITGNGTLANPYVGDFDFIIHSNEFVASPANTVFHLLPGVYHTRGYNGQPTTDLILGAGTKIVGSGMYATTIQRDRSTWSGAYLSIFFNATSSSANNIEISDLTVDCNGVTGDAHGSHGINLPSSMDAVRRVQVKNACGTSSEEVWSITVGTGGTAGGIISDCVVTNVQGVYTEGIGIGGACNATGNKIYEPATLPGSYVNFVGLQSSYTCNAIIRDNYITGGASGFYTDTGAETNLMIVGNSFENIPLSGISFAKGPTNGYSLDGIYILNNIIENAPNGSGIGFVNYDPNASGSYQNLVISGNTIRHYGTGASTGGNPIVIFYVLGSTLPLTNEIRNVRIVNNTIDRSFPYPSASTAFGNYIADNTDLSGLPLAVTNVTTPDCPSCNTYTYSCCQTDGIVSVITNVSSVYLPDAWGMAGKEIKVINRLASGNVTIYPTSVYNGAEQIWESVSNSILPSGPVTISQNQVATFISDGSANWIHQ